MRDIFKAGIGLLLFWLAHSALFITSDHCWEWPSQHRVAPDCVDAENVSRAQKPCGSGPWLCVVQAASKGSLCIMVSLLGLLLLVGIVEAWIRTWKLIGDPFKSAFRKDQACSETFGSKDSQQALLLPHNISSTGASHMQSLGKHQASAASSLQLKTQSLRSAATTGLQLLPSAPVAGTHSSCGSAVCRPIACSQDGIMDVWILAGQSNCVGFNQQDGQVMPPAAAPWPGRILCFDGAENAWKTAVPNVHLGVWGYADANSCGPDMAFARALIRSGTAQKVGLVPAACGGTNLFDQWAPGGELWSSMVTTSTAALQQLGCRGRLAGLLWVQGESDAFRADTAAAYSTNFTAWLVATRAALQAYCPCLSVVMAVMATRRRQGAFPFIDVVAQQQRDLKVPALVKVEMAGCEFYPQGNNDLVHLTKAGCCTLGSLMGYEVAAARRGCGVGL